ncbi:MAG TPA: TetR/AcrR family transcriptional regulator [Methanosarcina sp.]|jgi:AcrR family transcriptional regulator|nr:TetR/AcrR family transcriptional regulator [Methanosarcina sp.]
MTLAERRQREKDKRREDILNAAEKLFFSQGYDNVSMDEIANEAELSKPALYYYFKDKESLFSAVVNRGIKILRAMTLEELKNSRTNGLKVGAMNLAVVKFGQEYPDHAKALDYFWSGRFDLSNPENMSPDAKAIIEFSCENYRRTISIVKDGIEDGTFRSDADPFLVAVLIALIGSGVAQMNPFLRKNMEKHGISMQRLNLEVGDLAYRMVMHIEEGNENIRVRTLDSHIREDMA